MITLEINHVPVPWASPRRNKHHSYSIRAKEKLFFQWQIKSQYNRESPISGPVRLVFAFHMPITKNTSGIRKTQMLNGRLYHIFRPDCSNLVKHAEDCLKGIVIDDDSQVVDLHAQKFYSERPRVVIQIEELT